MVNCRCLVTIVGGIDVNDVGQILVEGATAQGYRYYVLSLIPEPAVTVIALACAAQFIKRRRFST